MRRRTAARSELPLQLQQRQLPSPASACGWVRQPAGCAGLVAGTSIFFHLAKKGNQAEAVAEAGPGAGTEAEENMQQILIQNTHANFSNSHA